MDDVVAADEVAETSAATAEVAAGELSPYCAVFVSIWSVELAMDVLPTAPTTLRAARARVEYCILTI